MTTEIWFYHLERAGLEDVLPGLLEKTLERGWRAVVRASNPERIAALDAHLWTYRDTAFLPHGGAGEGAAEQPVYLTCGEERPNGARALFLVDRARLSPAEAVESDLARIVVVFDGRDEAALAEARALWREAQARGLEASYWQQAEKGWSKKA
ncbi:MAG: DNA polymerase III subunit chi [Alphaproteobacteria bacterium]|nr:DNA polymerase III subunit chi [Alphaproteobacteria bacterium]